MARFEGLKYIPMFMRAYQEARHRSALARSGTADADPPLHHDREAGPAPSTDPRPRRAPRKPRGGKSAVPVRTVRVHAGGLPTRRSGSAAAGPGVNARSHRLVRVQPRSSMASRSPYPQSALGSTEPLVANLLRELRSTKQQLSQLRELQVQLTQLQHRLDKQLRALGGAEADDSAGPVAAPPPAEETHAKAAGPAST